MNLTLRSNIFLLFICLLLLPFQASAELAGHVILAKGSVIAVSNNGENRALKRRSKIMSGDVIKTGINSSVQIRFVDKALMTIKANTEMDITEYQLAKPNAGQKEKAIMKLVKGGFRTISGQIGKGDKSAYKVDTPAASIGIRGTNYEVQQEASGDFVMAVYSGGISVKNESGSIELGLGSDFNFTRVSPKGAPKGLLVAPATLSENSATDEPAEEESEAVAETDETTESDDESDESAEETALAEGDDANDEQNAEQDDDTTQLAISSDDSAQDVGEDVADALDEKLSEALQENKDEFEVTVISELIDQGYLTDGESLDDLDNTVLENLENLGSLDNLTDAENLDLNEEGIIPDPSEADIDTVTGSDFIQGLYSNLTSVTNPFANSNVTNDIITNQEYDLVASEKLAVMAMPMLYTQEADGSLTFNFEEANLASPNAVDNLVFSTNPLAASTAEINISFSMLNTSTNTIDEYDISIPIDVAVSDPNFLLSTINNNLTSGNITISMNGTTITPSPITSIAFTISTPSVGFSEFQIVPNAPAGSFITEMDAHFSGDDANILATMMGGQSNNDDWHYQSDIDLMIASGAWEMSADGDGNPIFVMSDTYTENVSGTDVTLNRDEVVKPNSNAELTSSLFEFASCGNEGRVCSIQVLKDQDNIRWGAWLTEPGKGIQIFEQLEEADGSTTLNIKEEDKILAFWLAAERADINNLSGTAQFSTTDLDCTDFSQCIGFADDGIVQNLSGQFDVNFNNGAITNGNLNIEVSDSASLVLGQHGTANSTWDVNFSGQMSATHPEFVSNSVNGTVVDDTGVTVSNTVIGNIGGIIVNPGDKAAGGYNLGTADGTNKHVSGVFTLDKQP